MTGKYQNTEFFLTIQPRAQADLHKYHKTSHQGGYRNDGGANNTMEIQQEFYNLAQATAEDHTSFTNLTTENSTFPEQVTLYTNHLPTKEMKNEALYTAVKNLQGYFKNVKAEVSTLKRSYHSAGAGAAKKQERQNRNQIEKRGI